MDLAGLVEMIRGRRVVALTGAGCSTESGIPDYRGARDGSAGPRIAPEGGRAESIDTPPRVRAPIQHREFVDKDEVRRRYWARSLLGWPKLSAATPNAGHTALAALEHAGIVAGVITQNVDSLHTAAGSRNIVELHGALARVQCLSCHDISSRHVLQDRLLGANHRWLVRAGLAGTNVGPGDAEIPLQTRPDGDVDLPDALVADFELVTCTRCGGVLMPDVVFFGGSVPRLVLDAAWELFDQAELLLVLGSSLTVFSGYRFVRRASERSIPVAILNRGPTRGDPHAQLIVDARVGEALPALARALT